MAREIALRQLTVRARTEAELRAALARRHVPTEAVDEVVERFSEVGLLDDVAYARDWVASGERRFKSRRSLAQELAAKGVDRETIDSALESRDAEVELEAARALGRKKAAATQGLDPAVRYRRLAGALARRGFLRRGGGCCGPRDPPGAADGDECRGGRSLGDRVLSQPCGMDVPGLACHLGASHDHR